MKKKNTFWIYQFLILVILLTLTISCKKEDPIDPAGTVSDSDGNVYETVTIGTQTWMAENLKTTKYNDGTDIPNVTDAVTWAGLSTPGYCWYENDIANKTTYGALYNWYTVNTGKLAPTGWHVPTNDDFETLCLSLGGTSSAGAKLKESGTAHWESPNEGSTNETGFTAIPTGLRYYEGDFSDDINLFAYWWNYTEYSSTSADAWYLNHLTSNVNYLYYHKEWGFSVRCVKD